MGVIWKHKNGGAYRIVCTALNEADLKPMVVYQNVETSQVWVRPADEFLDGRFTTTQYRDPPESVGVSD